MLKMEAALSPQVLVVIAQTMAFRKTALLLCSEKNILAVRSSEASVNMY
jgi:hypothetical protein